MTPLIINMRTSILKRLRIARHNKVVHLITQTLQANKNTRFFTLTNASNLINQIVPEWLLKCTCPQRICQCHAKLRPDILCIIGAPNWTQTPISPSPKHTCQFIDSTYCYDRFPKQALMHKHTKLQPTNQYHTKQWLENQPPHYHHCRSKRSYTRTLHKPTNLTKNL